AADLPVGRLGRDPLRFSDDPLLDLQSMDAGLLASCLMLLAPMVDKLGHRLKPGAQAVKIADCHGIGHRGEQTANRGPGVCGGQVRGGDALLKQDDLGRERVELALEELERLGRAAGLPRAHLALAIGGPHVDGAVIGYPAPRIVSGAHREPPAQQPGRRLVRQVFLMVTLSMTTLSFGLPPPAGLSGGPKPRLPTFWMILSPLTIVPNGVE